MVDQSYEFKIIKDHDVDSLKSDFDKVDIMKLDMKNNKLSKVKFDELFERLAATKLQYFQLDFMNYEGLDSDKIDSMVKCLRSWNLKTLILLFSGVKMSDDHFESLVFETLRTHTNLENLYLDLERCNLSKSKLRTLERIIPKLDNLSNLFINVKNNDLEKTDIVHISKEIQHIPTRELLF
jgi:hypothetical protein